MIKKLIYILFFIYSITSFANGKTVIILGHPNYKESKINKTFIESLPKNQNITIHNIAEIYPDGNINIEKEQKLLESADKIIFQYPINWFNMPSIMKIWWDKVFIPGWTNLNGTALKNKKMGIVVTAGIPENNLKELGYTTKDIIKPLELTIKYIGANYIGDVTVIGTSHLSNDNLNKNIIKYQNLILVK